MSRHMTHTGDSKGNLLASARVDVFYFYTPSADLCQNVFQHAEWCMHGPAHL